MHTPPPAEVHHEAVTCYVSAVAQANSARGSRRSRKRRAPLATGLRSGLVLSAAQFLHEPMLTPYAVEQSSVAGKGGAKPTMPEETHYPSKGAVLS